MSLNINNSDDFSYRYKMPPIETLTAGKGNGCFTFLMNIKDVAKSLGHPEEVILKYIGCVLGSGTNNKKLSITGHFKNKDIQKVIFQYIKSFILCPKCNIPELLPEVVGKKKRKNINIKCSACGYYGCLEGEGKYFSKGIDLLIKYIDKSGWKVIKGNMVEENFSNFM